MRPFSTWFILREQHLKTAINRLVETVRQSIRSEICVGTNAIALHAAALCGQDYKWLSTTVDFVQPLFGYMRYIFQCCISWARLAQKHVPDLSEPSSIAGSWSFLDLTNFFCHKMRSR